MLNYPDVTTIIPALRDTSPGTPINALTMSNAGTYFTEPMHVGRFSEILAFLLTTTHSGSTPTLNIKFQTSPDKITWSDLGVSFAQVTTTDGQTLVKLSAFGRYIRAVITLGGTTPSYKLTLSLVAKVGAGSVPLDSSGNVLVSPGAGTSFGQALADGSAFTQNTTPGTLEMGVYVSSPQTLVSGTAAAIALDVNRNQLSSLATLLAGENLVTNRLNNEPIYSSTSITTQTTTTVKSGSGTLAGFLIPTPVATATIKIYDNTAASGTVLVDTITLPAALISDGPIFVKCDASFATGLTVITGTATMAVDIYYR